MTGSCGFSSSTLDRLNDEEFFDEYYEGKCDATWIAPNKSLLLFSMRLIPEIEQERERENMIIKKDKEFF